VAVKSYRRPTMEEFVSVEECDTGAMQVREIDQTLVEDACYLRPKTETNSLQEFYEKYMEEQEIQGDEGLYSLVHIGKTAELWNAGFREHTSSSPNCQGDLDWDIEKSKKWGLCKAMALKCSRCAFQLGPVKLYEEVDTGKRGRKAAGPNLTVQVALARQGIGPSGLVDLLHGMQMESPTLCGLYKAGHQVCEKLVQANIEDMEKKIQEVKTMSANIGRKQDLIAVQVDTAYNTRLSSGVGKTPMQPATQATHLTVENMTPRKYIVHLGTYSKLCRACPQGQHGGPKCTQTISFDAPPGNEGKYIQDAISDLNASGVYVAEVTMDGDSNANKTSQEIVQDNGMQIVCQRCIRHLGQTMRLAIKTCTFSNDMFPGANLDQKRYIQARFAIDIVHRCQAEAKHICQNFRGDFDAIVARTSVMSQTVIKCYQGDCSKCWENSFVCSKDKPWSRPFLSTIKVTTNGRDFITPTGEDQAKLHTSLQKRFSYAGMMKTFKDQTSNKCEGCNRAIIKSLPKSLTFIRAYPGRASAAVHSVNNNPGVSLVKLCLAIGAPLPRCLSLMRQLKQSDIRYIKARLLQNTALHHQRRTQKRTAVFKAYDDKKAEKYYKKGLADMDGAIPSCSGEPVRAKRLTQARKSQAESIAGDFGSQGWDHAYSYHPR